MTPTCSRVAAACTVGLFAAIAVAGSMVPGPPPLEVTTATAEPEAQVVAAPPDLAAVHGHSIGFHADQLKEARAVELLRVAAELDAQAAAERAERTARAAAAPSLPPAQRDYSNTGGDPADPATWDQLAACESGGNWAANTGNGYYGGIQFSLSTWQSNGGTGYPHEASKATQIEVGRRLQATSGWGPWPACTRKLGWR